MARLLLCFSLLFTAIFCSADTVRYTYDDLGRLDKVINTSGEFAQYLYDANGNIVAITRGVLDGLQILSLTPGRGSVGSRVLLDGIGFSNNPVLNDVRFNGVSAEVVGASETALTVVVPVGATTGPVSVAVGAQSAVSDRPFILAPNVELVSPNFVLAGETTTLSFTGSSLAVAELTIEPGFNGQLSIANVNVAASGLSGSLEFTAPENFFGAANLFATSGDGRSQASATNLITVLIPGADDDNDGLSNAQELALGVSPLDPDSDDDGIPDGVEAVFGSGLLDANSRPVSVDLSASRVAGGDSLLIELYLSNQSEQVVNGVVVALTTPPALTFHEFNDVAPDADSVSCGGTSSSARQCTTAESASWSLGSMQPGETRFLQVRADVLTGFADMTSMPFEISIGAIGLNAAPFTENFVIDSAPKPQLAISEITDAVGVVTGYEFTVGNPTATDVTNLLLQLSLPPEGINVAEADGGALENNTIVWSFGNLSSGAVARRQVELSVANDLSDGALLNIQATLIAGGVELQAVDSTLVVQPPPSLVTQFVTSLAGEDQARYELVIANVTDQPLNNVQLQLRTPDQLSFHEFNSVIPDANSVSCGGTSSVQFLCNDWEEAFWLLGTLDPGSSWTIDIDGTLQGTDGELATMPLLVTAAGSVFSRGNVVAALGDRPVNVSLTTRSPIYPGAQTIDVQLGNDGAESTGPIEMRLKLPRGATPLVLDGGTYDGGNDEIVWVFSDLAGGSALRRQVEIGDLAGAVAGTIYRTRVEIYPMGASEFIASAEDALPFSGSQSLYTALTSVRDPVFAGERNRYQIVVSNLSSEPVANTSVWLRTPDNFAFGEFTDTIPDASSISCGGTSSSATVCTGGDEAVWFLGTLAPGENRYIDLFGTVQPEASPGQLIDVSIWVYSDSVDALALNKSVAVGEISDVGIALNEPSNQVVAGTVLPYTVEISNSGTDPLAEQMLKLNIPDGISVLLPVESGGNADDDSVVWSGLQLNAGEGLRRTVQLQVSEDASEGEIFIVAAELMPDGASEPTHVAQSSVAMNSSSALAANVASSAIPVGIGLASDYEITVSNQSDDLVNDVRIWLRTPAGLTFHERDDTWPDANSQSCGGTSSSAVTCTEGEEAFWNLGTLAPGASGTVRLRTTIDDSLGSGELIDLPYAVTGNGASNLLTTRTVRTAVPGAVELSLVPSVDPVPAGQDFSYEFSFGNTDSNALADVFLRLSLPSGLTLSSLTDGASFDPLTSQVEWNVGTVASGQTLRRTLDVLVESDAADGTILPATLSLFADGDPAPILQTETNVAITDVPALVASISASPDPVSSSGQLDYEITFSNLLSQAVNDTLLELRTPSEISFHEFNNVAPDASSLSCGGSFSSAVVCDSGEEAYWSFGTLGGGESRTVTISSAVSADAPDGGLIQLPARVVTSAGVVEIGSTVHLSSSKQLQIALATSEDPVQPDMVYTYTIDVSNPTESVLADVVLRLVLSDGVAVEEIGDGGLVNPATGEVEWVIDSLSAGGVVRREVQVRVDALAVDGLILSALASGQVGAATEVEVTAQRDVTVNSTLALVGGISARPSPVVAGGQLDYEITISNISLGAIDDVVVLLRTPAGISFHETNNTAPDASSISCGGTSSSSVVCNDGEEAFWLLGTLTPGESRSIDVSATVDANLPDGSLISTPILITGTNADPISLERTVQVQAEKLLNIALGASDDPVTPGGSLTYFVDLGNASNSDLMNASMRMRLPAQVAVLNISDGGVQDAQSGEVVWNTDLSAGAVIHREVEVQVDAGVPDGTILNAQIEARLNGTTEANATSERAVSVDSALAMVGWLGVSPNPTASSEQLNVQVTVSNVSAQPIEGVNVLLRTPAQITFHERLNTFPDADPSSCGGTSSSSVVCDSGEEALWLLGTIGPGESRSIDISSTVVAGLDDADLITVPVTIRGTGVDAISLERTVPIQSQSQLAVALTPSAGPVAPGQVYEYSLDVGNPSSTSVDDVVLRLALPGEVSISSVSDGGTVDGATGDILWNIASIAAGGVVRRDVSVVVDGGVSNGTILDARVEARSGGSTQLDASAEQAINVSISPALVGYVTAFPSPVGSPGQLDYEIFVGNLAASSLEDVQVLVRTPAGLTFHESLDTEPNALSLSCGGTGSSATTCSAGGEAVWFLGALAPGASRKITLSANVVGALVDGALITVPILLSAAQADSVSFSSTVAIQSNKLIEASVVANVSPVVPGQTYTYELLLSNVSGTILNNVESRFVLPADVSLRSIVGPGVQEPNGDVSWDVPVLAADGNAMLSVEVMVDALATSGANLMATLDAKLATGPETVVAWDNTIPVASQPGLTISIVPSAVTVAAGGALNYQLQVDNNTGSDVTDVSIVLRTPPEISFHESIDANPAASSVSCGGTFSSTVVCDNGEEAIWGVSSIAAGASFVVDLDVDVEAGLVNGSLVVLPVSVLGANVDPASGQSVVRIQGP